MALEKPDLPAGVIVEELDDGGMRRNDGVVLRPAHENPWYVLATLDGEQLKDADWVNYDREVAQQNLMMWTQWLNGQNADEIERRFRARISRDIPFPKPAQNIDFSSTYFDKFVCFEGYIFRGEAIFIFANFGGDVSFRSSAFQNVAMFRSAVFDSDTDFNSSTFKDEADFSFSLFLGATSFSSAVFLGDADYHSVEIAEDIFFMNTEFNQSALFTWAKFKGASVFSSANFKSATMFDDAHFLTNVPLFHAAALYDETTFTLPDHYDENWPIISANEVMPADQQKRAYNRLRLFMNKNLQIEEEQFFHRMEMRCKRETENWIYRPIYSVFEGLSDYGNSVMRPVGALFLLWLVGVSVKIQPVVGEVWPDIQSLPHAMGWSLANVFPFFGFRRLYFDGTVDLVLGLKVIGGGQTVMGFVLLFFLGLGLRNRFRLR